MAPDHPLDETLSLEAQQSDYIHGLLTHLDWSLKAADHSFREADAEALMTRRHELYPLWRAVLDLREQIRLTRESLHERPRLLQHSPGADHREVHSWDQAKAEHTGQRELAEVERRWLVQVLQYWRDAAGPVRLAIGEIAWDAEVDMAGRTRLHSPRLTELALTRLIGKIRMGGPFLLTQEELNETLAALRHYPGRDTAGVDPEALCQMLNSADFLEASDGDEPG